MPEVRFDTYYRYDELTQILHDYASEYPHLVELSSIGQSYEGRDLWLVTVTNTETGADRHKPGLWVDGNIHASEVAPSSACLYLINKLVTEYETDPDIKRCLDTRVFYICPRINPDGAEWALADNPTIIRSSTRPYPYDEEPEGGLVLKDVDGDGRMLLMRIPDPNGAWKVCPEDPRLLVRRDPTEYGGQYYRVLREGRIKDYDGTLYKNQPIKEGLDLNRNYPINWRQEYQQDGAGPYPTSEPEVRAGVDFVASHPNITGGIAFHTMSGVLLRPYGDHSDDYFPFEDLRVYERIGQQGTDTTGYPAVSVYHGFRYNPDKVISGVFDDWLYDHMGLFAWVVEIWNPQDQAGIEDFEFMPWRLEHPLEDDLKLLKWSDEVLEGKGYVDWYPFDHPELGEIELGGWDWLFTLKNPPHHLLEKEIAPFADWLIWHLLISPCLELYETQVQALADETYLVQLTVQNTGWLPTYVTKKALEKKLVRGVICEIELPDGATVISSERRQDIGQLEGRAYKPTTPFLYYASDITEDMGRAEWLVRAPQGTKVTLTARHDRAGQRTIEVELNAQTGG